MTRQTFFSSYSPCAGNQKIKVVDGSLSAIARKGSIVVSPSITLYNVLHVSNFLVIFYLLVSFPVIQTVKLIFFSTSLIVCSRIWPRGGWLAVLNKVKDSTFFMMNHNQGDNLNQYVSALNLFLLLKIICFCFLSCLAIKTHLFFIVKFVN